MEKNKGKQEVVPVNTKAKDTFFKKVYEKEERQRGLAAALLGIDVENVTSADVKPVLFGNKENDFACVCDSVFYVLAEAQSSVSPNIPYRLLEYATAGLRGMVDSERLLYGRKRVYFPVPKFYVLQVDSLGRVFPCPPLGFGDEFSLGNAVQTSLYDIWHGRRLRELQMEHLNHRRHSHPVCGSCENYLCFTPKEDNLDLHAEEIRNRLELEQLV